MLKKKTYCDSCGKPAVHYVGDRDSFYEYLCDDCYEDWESDHPEYDDDEF